LAGQSPAQALVHLKRILELEGVPHELVETTPVFMAQCATVHDLPEWDAKDQQLGGDTVWGEAASLLRERLKNA